MEFVMRFIDTDLYFFKFSIRFISMKPYYVDMIGYKKDM